ncbi:DoxX family protein [Deinococcus oregonensis]|uniref:DoxX family protein n=1 Tax=Deinococcus oregonensis TaxID=1805970 RepID=A0ABV6B8Z7_9DEIO
MLTLSRSSSTQQRLYWAALSLFSLVFIGSAILTVVDVAGSNAEYRHLGFPTWLLYPQSLAKVLGIVALLFSRSRTLKDFAFAGFLYNLLLALGGHLSQMEIDVLLPLITLGIWVFAFTMDRKMFPTSAGSEPLLHP